MSARNSSALLKRARVDDDDEADPSTTTMTISSSGGEGLGKNALVRQVKRTSGLTAPIVSLAGAHQVSTSRDAVRGSWNRDGTGWLSIGNECVQEFHDRAK